MARWVAATAWRSTWMASSKAAPPSARLNWLSLNRDAPRFDRYSARSEWSTGIASTACRPTWMASSNAAPSPVLSNLMVRAAPRFDRIPPRSGLLEGWRLLPASYPDGFIQGRGVPAQHKPSLQGAPEVRQHFGSAGVVREV